MLNSIFYKRIILLIFAIFVYSNTSAADFWQYPVIHAYGPVHVWPDVVNKPNPAKSYKAIFDLTEKGSDISKINEGLVHIARAVNTFVAAGVPLANLKFAIIIHGKATPIALDNKTFLEKFKHDNPNMQIIEDLKKSGVEVLVCGNALADMHFKPEEVNKDIKVALSTLTTLVIKQNDGYALMRM